MKYLFIIFLLLSNNSYAITLNEVLNSSLRDNIYLDVIKKKIEMSTYDIKNSDNYSNPEFFLLQNSIDSTEPMRSATFGFKQKIDGYGQLDQLRKISINNKNIESLNLAQAKLRLIYNIKSIAYDIWTAKEKIDIIDEFIYLSNKSTKILSSYSLVNNSHLGLINTELNLYNLKIKKLSLQKTLKKKYSILSYLASRKINNLELKLKIDSKIIKSEDSIINNLELSIINEELNRQNNKIKKSKYDLVPDLNIASSYSVRENFNNFYSVGLSFKIPLYGTESNIIQKEKIKKLMIEKKYKDKYEKTKSSYDNLLLDLKNSYDIFQILNNKSMKTLEHLLNNSLTSISSGEGLFKYIEVLKAKLNLEIKKINAIHSFNKTRAMISLIIGKNYEK